jgi:hypothetical protein
MHNGEPMLTVTVGGQKHRLNIGRAFSLAHQLVCRGKLDPAIQVLEWLESALPNDRRVKVLHARAEARRGDFASCSQLLNEVFLEKDHCGDVPGPLHVAIVYRATGLLPDARHELKEICAQHPELPSLWLFAGDLWLAVGRADRAKEAWQVAVQHDIQKPRVIATAALNRIHELAAKDHRD